MRLGLALAPAGAVAAFDRNPNGKREPEEMEALMKFLQGVVR
jgi:hypothetical protein